MMLNKLGFHKTAVFFPFPEYWAGKLGPKNLQRIRDKINSRARYNHFRALGLNRAMNSGTPGPGYLLSKELHQKLINRRDKFEGIRRVMDKALELQQGGK